VPAGPGPIWARVLTLHSDVAERTAHSQPDGGSWLAGTVSEVVYLGMLTQYHASTVAGRVVSHRMNDEAAPTVEVGTLVVVEWAAEDTSVLGPSV